MEDRIENRIVRSAAMALLAVIVTVTSSSALELAAVRGEWTDPSGSVVVPMWGFVEVPVAADYVCSGTLLPWTGGPVLSNNVGTVDINLKNCLDTEVSVFIPGLNKALVPVMQGDRLYSLDAMVAPGVTGNYTWTATEGTYLVHSGTDIRTQVPMGLYGALVVTNDPVVSDQVLIYSEIDPLLNADPATFGGARVSNWEPKYFLINGATYPGIDNIVVEPAVDVLLRFVNAGLETYVPTFDGGFYMDVVAEDGNPYPHPLTQYGLELVPGKTFDVLVNMAGEKSLIPLYDRSLHLASGGMTTYLYFPRQPIAVNDTYEVIQGNILNVAAPGVLANDTDANGDPLTAAVDGLPNPLVTLNLDGGFSFDASTLSVGAVETFNYVANDGTSDSMPAQVTITVINAVPVARNDTASILVSSENRRITRVTLNIVENDDDPDGVINPTSVNITSGSRTLRGGSVVNHSNGYVTYTPRRGYLGTDSFQYTVEDNDQAVSNVATVSIRVASSARQSPVQLNRNVRSSNLNPTVDRRTR